jgi:hypothetical protein
MSGVFLTTLAVLSLFIHSALAQTCVVGTYAGVSGTSGFSGDGGDATSAKLNTPEGSVWVDTAKVMFVTDQNNHRIRKVDPNSKIITTIVGKFSNSLLC